MRFYLQHKETRFVLEIEAATIGTFAQVAIWLIGKHLGWF